jgi:DNA modification methylase
MESQITLFMEEAAEKKQSESPKCFSNSEWGTFKDSLRAPIHSWFPYPAGFSYKAVEHFLQKFHIADKDIIYDPFCGAGTTPLVAKSQGISSVGVEAHPFIYFVAKTKTCWTYKLDNILSILRELERMVRHDKVQDKDINTAFPDLVHRCFSKNTLKNLYSIREAIKSVKTSQSYEDFFNLALTCILRPVANVATGWPYIAPDKKKNGKEKDTFSVFYEMVLKMYGDIQSVKDKTPRVANCKITNGDSRNTRAYIDSNTISCIFTSPPYLNNFDYADRTRLETYFFGWTKNWGEITEQVRSKLIMSATTQINRGQYKEDDIFLAEFKHTSPIITKRLQNKINKLSKVRLEKGGKKSYDILVGGYFNDMYLVLKDCFRILKKGSTFALILGDSAPYGIYIPTDEILGQIGQDIGFASYDIEELRKRGNKWKANPQRHQIKLHETILYLKK